MPVMSLWTRQTSLKLPATGKVTMQLEPSKIADPVENPGQPTLKGGRIWPSVRKVTVCQFFASAPGLVRRGIPGHHSAVLRGC
jgi:hypothetical protein